MTCKEKLKIEHPDLVNPMYTDGGCCGCPHHYGYARVPKYCDWDSSFSEKLCYNCWDREVEDL